MTRESVECLMPESATNPALEKQPEFGDLVVEYLERIGVEYIFGVPGGAIEPLYNAMARSARRGGLRPIVARHEAGAAFMADGYARETGKLGVCCSTTGPGATNLLTGVASAFADNVPLLVLTAQTALHLFGKRTLQESSCTAVNTVAMFQSCTRFSTLVSHRGQLEGKLLTAIMATQGPPAGPAHLSIPTDVLSAPRRLRLGEPDPRIEALFKRQDLSDPEGIDSLFNEVVKSRRIVLVLGDSCGEAIAAILEFAELVGAAIITGPSGKRWVDHRHPQFRGVLGYAGHASANAALRDEAPDLVLAVGTRLGEMIFNDLERDAALQKKLIQIDETTEPFTHSPMARLYVRGTLGPIFRNLTARLRDCRKNDLSRAGNVRKAQVGEGDLPLSQVTLDEPDKFCSDAIPLKPQRVMRELASKFPERTRFIVDAGNSWAWATHYLFPRSSGLYRVGMGFGSMGWAIGAAVGTALGSRGTPVVCLTGDGSFLMSGQEITVAVAERLPVIFVLLNDQALGMVKHGQRLGGAEPVAFELPPVDFVQMARSMGAQAHLIRTVQDLEGLDIEKICRRPGPTLLNVRIDPEEVPPMRTRMKVLGR